MEDWHRKSAEEVMRILRTSPLGLDSEEARKRLVEYGPNELVEKPKRSPFMMFLGQFGDFMILVLIAAAVISGAIGELSDTIAILVIVLLNAVIGFVQQYRAERAMAALKKMAAHSATVRRAGAAQAIAVSEIVPGDVVVMEAGQLLPADMRLTEAVQLKVEEAALTGESEAVGKTVDALRDDNITGDRKNMVFKGTFVTNGRGAGVVTATGMETELGRIAAMLQEEEEVKTPLQKRLAVFGRRIAVAVLVICAIVFGIGVMRGRPPMLMLLTAISLAVAAIPEALPAVITISLALGAQKMARQNALVRKLPAVETLGSVTYICSDKTGTLTLNRMTVEKIYADGMISGAEAGGWRASGFLNTPSSALFTALALSNDAEADGAGGVTGDPTEVALYAVARDMGFDKTAVGKAFPRRGEIPFDSERKCMTTFHQCPSAPVFEGMGGGRFISFTKGAIDVLIDKSAGMLTARGVEAVDRGEIFRVNEEMAAQGLRVLGVAMRRWEELPAEISPEIAETDLTVLGLVGMMDPPREEAKEAVRLCRAAGIRPVMITGDYFLTAKTIAGRLGMLDDDPGAIITGRQLEKLPPEDFEKRVERIKVYARVVPEQKLKIVKALQDRGQYVAMTGDGVNDAPALKRADIGIAMGITGTDVSKESADMILLDDNFATIVNAVKEGRRIYENIRKFIKYLLATNSGEIWTLFLAPLLGLPIPLLPIHILWINLMTDGLPALALSAEPAEADVMNKPPRDPAEGIFAGGMAFFSIYVGLLMAAVCLSVEAFSLKTGHLHWQTMVFTVLCLTQLGNALAIRSDTESLFKVGIFTNKFLLGAIALSFLLQMAAIYVPVLSRVFRTERLSPGELAAAVALSSVVFFAVETGKFLRRRKRPGGNGATAS